MIKICFTVLAITVLLSACAAIPDNTNKTENTTEKLIVDQRGIYARTVEEYDALIAAMEERYGVKLPENFVTWDKLTLFGDFHHFVYVESGFYLYNVKTPGGNVLMINVHDVPNGYMEQEVTEITLTEDMKAEMTDMRRIPTNNEVVIKRDGYQYRYDDGRLVSVDWLIDGIQFDFHGMYYLSENVKIPEGTFISRLLSISDVESDAAFVELRQKLTAE